MPGILLRVTWSLLVLGWDNETDFLVGQPVYAGYQLLQRGMALLNTPAGTAFGGTLTGLKVEVCQSSVNCL